MIPAAAWRLSSKLLNAGRVLTARGRGVRGLLQRDGRDAEIKLSDLTHPFYYRRNEAHCGAIIQNCIRMEYDRHLGNYRPATILDAGAYIGDLTAWWGSKWPQTKICALEPDSRNYDFAARNLRPYGDKIELLHGALWNKECFLTLAGSETGTSVHENASATQQVRAYTIPEIMSRNGWDRISILKMDIEGAEYAVLDENCTSWLGAVDWILLEYHGGGSREKVEAILAKAGFTGRKYRSIITYTRNWP